MPCSSSVLSPLIYLICPVLFLLFCELSAQLFFMLTQLLQSGDALILRRAEIVTGLIFRLPQRKNQW